MTSTLQDRLNGVTDILSRVSKLVSEDLEKAVTTAVGHDREGDLSLGKMKHVSSSRLHVLMHCLWFPGSPQDKRPVLAVVPSPAAPCHPVGKEGLSACEF